MTLQTFNRAVDTFARTQVPASAISFHKKIVLEALKRIIDKTPVDTGRAQGNWQTNIGSPIDREIDNLDKEGSRTLAKGAQALTKLGIFEVVYISNNVPYILQLEDGSSDQAAEGMVAVTLAELEGILE